MQKILIIRLSSIGDIVLISPIIRCVKQQLKDAEVHVLTKGQYQTLYNTNPYVSKIYTWEEENATSFAGLKAENYDFVVDLHKNIRTSKVKTILHKKGKSFPKLNFQKWLLVNFKKDILPNIHIVDRYFEAVKPLGVTNDQKGLDFFIQMDEEAFKKKFTFTDKYIVVAVGAKFATKRMPPKKLSEVLDGLPLPIVLIGGKEDQDSAQQIVELLPNQKITNTCGLLSFQESAQVIKDAQVIVTHDTGMMHIASAFELPIVSIWGNTVPAFGMYPYRPQAPNSYSIHEVLGLDCRPCSKIGFDTCPKGHFNCMMLQDTVAIQKRILQFLKNN
ncbi:MAG: glycosyltransferase family 9 protein [Brumimicrobium sp.]|nr:glycosyltransferase family 9 protein [Brumimicrobium sp.]